MRRKRLIITLLVGLVIIIILSANFTVTAKNCKKTQKWIATMGEIDPKVTYSLYTSTFNGRFLSRFVIFEGYTYYNGSIVSLESIGSRLGRVKVECKVYSLGNDLFLNLHIYNGGKKSPKISEIYEWHIINGKDGLNYKFIFSFKNIHTGEFSETITLSDGEKDIIKLPKGNLYYCIMYFY